MGSFFVASGQRLNVTLSPLSAMAAPAMAAAGVRGARAATAAFDPVRLAGVVSASPVLASRISDPSRLAVAQISGPGAAGAAAGGSRAAGAPSPGKAITLVTETLIAEGLRQADLAAARNAGATLVEEALDGKMLLRVDSVERVFDVIELLLAREVGSVTPNFIRRIGRPARSAAAQGWALPKIGVAEAMADDQGQG
jgi:hypothetical protein